jgi:hypothetical protein
MKTPILSSSRKSGAWLPGLLLAGALLAAPAAEAFCVSTTSAGLNTCRNTRRPMNWYADNIVTNATPVGSGSGMLAYR